MLIWPQAVIGKRWNMSSGLTVSPFIGVGYMLGELKASDGTYLELPDGSKADGGLGDVYKRQGVMMPPGPADGHGTVSTKMVMEKACFILSAVLLVQPHGTIRQMKG